MFIVIRRGDEKAIRGIARAAHLTLMSAEPSSWARRLAEISVDALEALRAIVQHEVHVSDTLEGPYDLSTMTKKQTHASR